MDDLLDLNSFINNLDQGPRGVDGAIAVIQECSASKSDKLDLGQMGLTDSDFQQVVSHLRTVAPHVTSLSLFMNELTELPESIGILSNLTVLLAGCNPLEIIADQLLPKLPCLTELDVGYSETLTQLPDTFSHTPQLTTLDAGNNRLESLPPSLFVCSLLRHLNLYGNCLKELSTDVGHLTALRTINVGRNQIEHLPPQLSSCTQLTTIHAYENCLEQLPSAIAQLPNLKILTVHGNPMLPHAPRDIRSKPGAQAKAAYYASLASTRSH